MTEMTIVVKSRETTGTGPNRRLRAAGSIPAVVYGTDRPSAAIEVGERTIQKLLREAGENAVFLLQLEGGKQSRNVMIRDIQTEPHTGRLVHIDFQRVKMDEEVHVTVLVETEGIPIGVKDEGGILDFITREVEIVCLPNLIPQHLTIDVSDLAIGDTVDTTHLVLPDGVALLEHDVRTVAAVNHPQLEVEEEEESDLLEGEAEEPSRIGDDDKADDDSSSDS